MEVELWTYTAAFGGGSLGTVKEGLFEKMTLYRSYIKYDSMAMDEMN